MERITPTHFIVDCQKCGGHYGPHHLENGSPEHYRGVSFVWRIKKTTDPLALRMEKRKLAKTKDGAYVHINSLQL